MHHQQINILINIIVISRLEKASLENSPKWISSFDFLQNEAIKSHTQQAIGKSGNVMTIILVLIIIQFQ